MKPRVYYHAHIMLNITYLSPLEGGCTTDPLPKYSLQNSLGFSSNFSKVQYLVFSNFLLVLPIFSFWEEDWTLEYNFMEF